MLGNLLGSIVRIVNAPVRAMEDIFTGDDECPEDERVLSRPLDALAEELDRADE